MDSHPIKPILKTLPTTPGCYIYKDNASNVLYVGKAKNLRKRINSYFQNYRELTARLQIMIDNAFDVEVHSVSTEVEALILEASLIKKYKPKYNIMLKDDKSYSWIKITKDPYPIVLRTRNNSDKNAIYFGPYTNAHARDQVFNFLRKEFPFRTCNYFITDEDLLERKKRRANGERVTSRLCTYYHIGRCGGPCESQVSRDEYSENINAIKKYLKNKKKGLVNDLKQKMKFFAETEQYEKAGKTKDQLDSLDFVAQKVMIGYGDDEDDVRRISYQRSMKGLETLIKTLKIMELKKMTKEEKAVYLENFRIECFDISNIQGTNPVGSMVVFEGGIAKKSHYRKFKINIKETPDDFAMMQEMLVRRFRYIRPSNKDKNLVDPSFSSIPDLIIIDGGKGQLGIAVDVLHDLKLEHLFLCGLAKRREEIFLPGQKTSYLFNEKKESLFLLQRVRDEAHRFGITYHRHRRSKAMLK